MVVKLPRDDNVKSYKIIVTKLIYYRQVNECGDVYYKHIN